MSVPEGVTQRGDVDRPVSDAADVVVIGSGAAGAAAALLLQRAGLSVVVLEEGPYVAPSAFRRDMWSAFTSLWRDAGMQVAEGRQFLPVLQGCAVGGTTVINGAIVHRIPDAIHDVWLRDFGAGALLGRTALDRAYDDMDALLGVAETPEAALGRHNTLMRDGCDALGWRSNVIQRNVIGCDPSGACGQGCAKSRKQSMLVAAIPEALRRGARLYATCKAERIVVERGRAVAVVGRFADPTRRARGPAIRVEARKAVLVAASAIQTPLLLAASGIGRRSGQLGRRFQAHPGVGLIGVYDAPVALWSGATQGYESKHFWDERMKFETVAVPLEVGAGRLPGFGPRLMERIGRFGHYSQIGVQVRARAMGSVRRGLTGRTRIRYDMTSEDVAVLKLGLKRVAQIIFASGARQILPGIHGLPEAIDGPAQMGALDHLPDDPRLFHGIVSHLFGTAVMGTDPARSVVGPDLQAHDARGVYVIDSSFFPTNMGVNPAHTVSAAAWLAAERIAGG